MLYDRALATLNKIVIRCDSMVSIAEELDGLCEPLVTVLGFVDFDRLELLYALLN